MLIVNCFNFQGMQNERGGYENDCSLVRLSHNHYMLIGPTEQQTRCLSWIQRFIGDTRVQVHDVTSIYTGTSSTEYCTCDI